MLMFFPLIRSDGTFGERPVKNVTAVTFIKPSKNTIEYTNFFREYKSLSYVYSALSVLRMHFTFCYLNISDYRKLVTIYISNITVFSFLYSLI